MAEVRKVLLPDIGDFEEVDVVEVLVAPGDRVEREQSLIVLESDKATLEIPAPFSGVISELKVRVGGTISQGDLVCLIETDDPDADDAGSAAAHEVREREPASPPREAKPAPAAAEAREKPDAADDDAVERDAAPQRPGELPAYGPPRLDTPDAPAHASPSVRRLARELGVDLTQVPGTGRKGRVKQEDVQEYVKAMLQNQRAGGSALAGVHVARAPEIDFSKFGPTELQPLNRVRRVSGANLHRSWVTVPHVTQHDEADVTELEAFRKAQREGAEREGLKLTFLPFIMKAVVGALREFPHFNASLDRHGENLILKQYFHVGVAVDTPQGLIVPVVRDVDQKGIRELAAELMEISDKARDRKLRPADLEGGTFTISSLGGIGGTFFTPIVNHPEVAVLGVSRMEWKPVYVGDELKRRLILPLSLSYDHRVIDGADAVRFTSRLGQYLSDIRLILL